MMKKGLLLLPLLAMLMAAQGAQAQFTKKKKIDKLGVFDHVGIGVGVGTTGIDFQVAAPITDYLALRTGYSFMPDGASYKEDVNYHVNGVQQKTEIEAELNEGDFKLLLDFYPLRYATFHITAGFFLGKERVVNAENTTPVTTISGMPVSALGGGLEIGDYVIGFDDDGIAHAAIQVKKFKPYVGIGFGRAVPRKRLNVDFELGTQFWGSPKVMMQSPNGTWTQATSSDVKHEDDGFIDAVSKVKVFPVLTLRLNGRIF